jgi:hypothetical protein
LTLEVLHDVQKAVVDIRVVTELYFYLIEIAQSVLQKIKRVSKFTDITQGDCVTTNERRIEELHYTHVQNWLLALTECGLPWHW